MHGAQCQNLRFAVTELAQYRLAMLPHRRHRVHAVVEGVAASRRQQRGNVAGRRAHRLPASARLQLRVGPQVGHVVDTRVGNPGGIQAFDPHLLAALSIDRAPLKLGDAIQLGTAAVFTLLTGWAADRIGVRPVMTVGVLLLAASFYGLGQVETVGGLYALRFVMGLGVSHSHLVNKVRGHDYSARPVATMRAYLEGMERALYMGPEPAAEAPIVLAALRQNMLQLAAEKTRGEMYAGFNFHSIFSGYVKTPVFI